MSIQPPMPDEIVVDSDIALRRSFDTPAATLHALIQQNIDHLSPWMFWAKPEYDVDGVAAFQESKKKLWNESGEHGYSIYFRDELAGAIGIRGFESPVRAVSLGYWLSAHLQHRGIMTRSVGALIRLAFEEYEMNQVIIRAATENAASRAIPERLGFTETGTERQMTINADGKLMDLVTYSLLQSEWRR